jgi:hypothetical protein
MWLTKLINNGATFYYRRIVSLQLPRSCDAAPKGTSALGVKGAMRAQNDQVGTGSNSTKGKNKVEQLRVLRVLM